MLTLADLTARMRNPRPCRYDYRITWDASGFPHLQERHVEYTMDGPKSSGWQIVRPASDVDMADYYRGRIGYDPESAPNHE